MSDDSEDRDADIDAGRGVGPDVGKGNRTSMVSVLAILISVSALLVSVFEVSAIRDEQRLQAWPYVTVGTGYNAEGFRITAVNKGIGPARVRSVTWTFDGEPFEQIEPVIEAVVGEERAFSYELYRASGLEQIVMSPDEAVEAFFVPWIPNAEEDPAAHAAWVENGNPDTNGFIDAFVKQGSVSLCFCSVYDDCWEATLNGGEPEPVRGCAVD
ncbi:MAG: hypothetical protein QNJ00_11715 [Woeseiaceae bacterium]|nr:hypothetical protein [Woeseiaceae bacterium]